MTTAPLEVSGHRAPRRAQRRTLGDIGRHRHHLSRIVEWDGKLDDLRLQRGSEYKSGAEREKRTAKNGHVRLANALAKLQASHIKSTARSAAQSADRLPASAFARQHGRDGFVAESVPEVRMVRLVETLEVLARVAP